LFQKSELELTEGATAMDALLSTGLVIDEQGGLVNSISGIASEDFGPTSGWLFKVNGEMGSEAASATILKPGDEVLWFYTVDFNAEFGS
jgi:hypothetical protein